ncbi:hypothetical protein [Rhodoferax sp.]|uniref:hypothetical protein n=1 Tax=Rhodoferax sp. TaxID=50421 RepID=UPI003BB5AB31
MNETPNFNPNFRCARVIKFLAIDFVEREMAVDEPELFVPRALLGELYSLHGFPRALDDPGLACTGITRPVKLASDAHCHAAPCHDDGVFALVSQDANVDCMSVSTHESLE